MMMGHYTPRGKEFKEIIFPKDYDGTDMAWFITEKRAYGGKECMKKLIKYGMASVLNSNHKKFPKNNFALDECTADCKTVNSVIIRSCSILTMGRIIEIDR